MRPNGGEKLKQQLKIALGRDLLNKAVNDLTKIREFLTVIAKDRHRITDVQLTRAERLNLDTLRLVAIEPIYAELESYANNHFLGYEETMRRLATQKVSFARFGDGEFKVMLRPDGNHVFQDIVPEIQLELEQVLTHGSTSTTLVGMPTVIKDPFWSNVWANYYPQLKKLYPDEAKYGCTHVTRPVYFRRWKQSAVEAWRKVWDGMDACVVTGSQSRFDLIPELFDTLNSAQFVYGANRNAYFDIDELENAALTANSDVVLISMGPTGTVLANRLAAKGQLALDIGHIAASYKNAFHDAARPEAQ
jgi:hypothetical protein